MWEVRRQNGRKGRRIMKNPMPLTIKDIANLVSQCKEMNVGCNIQFFPIEKEKKENADND